MKRKLQMLIMSMFILVSTATNSGVFAESNITVKLDGQNLIFDVQPQIINGRTMVPMRTIFEKLGATVIWDQGTQTVTSVKDDTTVKLTIGVPSIKVNQHTPEELDTAPCIINGRTLVPVRAISEAFDMNVEWDAATQTVLIARTNVNHTAYNKLKNIIFSEGSKLNEADESYDIFYKFDDESSILLTYNPTDDFIPLSLFFSSEGEEIEETVCIFLHEERVPGMLYTLRFSDGSEYKLYADFPNATKPFVITKNTIPNSMKETAIDLLNLFFAKMDVFTKSRTGVSFSDLGIYYEAD